MKEQRKSQRFALRLPFELVRSGAHATAASGETRNLSSTGVLFITDSPQLEVGASIEFVITLPTAADGHPVRLRCLGKVVRIEEEPDPVAAAAAAGATGVAATVERFEFVRGKLQ